MEIGNIVIGIVFGNVPFKIEETIAMIIGSSSSLLSQYLISSFQEHLPDTVYRRFIFLLKILDSGPSWFVEVLTVQ